MYKVVKLDHLNIDFYQVVWQIKGKIGNIAPSKLNGYRRRGGGKRGVATSRAHIPFSNLFVDQ